MENYNEYDMNSIKEYAEKSIGHKLSEYFDVNEVKPNNKGKVGNLFQKYYFGLPFNSSPEPDFKSAKLELKVFGYKQIKDTSQFDYTSYRADQRLALSTIDYFEFESDITFEESHLYKKCKNMLFIIFLLLPDKNREDSEIKYVRIYSIDQILASDKKQIINDFKVIAKKIKTGKASSLSESDTEILSAVRTGNKDSKPQPAPRNDKALPRRFALKQSYMTYLIQNYILTNSSFDKKILKSRNKKSTIVLRNNITFEDWLAKTEKTYINKTTRQISIRKKIKESNKTLNPTSKNYLFSLGCAMLGIESNKDPYLVKTNTCIKAIYLNKNNSIKESISFPTFKCSDLVENDDWINSSIYNYYSETRFVFLIFKHTDKGIIYFGHYILKLTAEDLEKHLKPVWEKTRNILMEGIKFELTIIKDKPVMTNNLPKAQDNELAYVKCHSQKAAYNIDLKNITGCDERAVQFIQDHSENGRYLYRPELLSTCSDTLPNHDQITSLCFWIKPKYVRDNILKEKIL